MAYVRYQYQYPPVQSVAGHKDGYIPDPTGPSHERNAKRWIGAPSAVSVKMDAYVFQAGQILGYLNVSTICMLWCSESLWLLACKA